MKRTHIIDRLVEGVGHNRRELDNLSNENLRAKAMQEIARLQQLRENQAKRQKARIQAQLEDQRRQAEWVDRCTRHALKPITDRAAMNFGLAHLVAHAKLQFRETGSQDAAATLRVILGGNPVSHEEPTPVPVVVQQNIDRIVRDYDAMAERHIKPFDRMNSKRRRYIRRHRHER